MAILGSNRAFLRNKKALLESKRAETKELFWKIKGQFWDYILEYIDLRKRTLLTPPLEWSFMDASSQNKMFKKFSRGTIFPQVIYPDP